MSITAFPTVKLADCVDLLAGFAFKSQHFTDSPDDIPLVKGENVSQGCILWEISKRWSAADWPILEKFQLRTGDVVVAMDRPWVPAGLKWAYIRSNDPKALLVQRCSRLRSNTQRLDQDFLRFVIGGPGFESYVIPITTGVNVPHISGKQILDYEFSLPPLPVQQRIAGILSAYDELIENCQRRIKILESMARALYREWFVHFRFPGNESHPRVDSPIGEIPDGWEVKKLADICSKLIDGTHDSPPPVEAGYPLITGRHIKGGFIDFSDAYLISPEEHKKVMKRSRPELGDIIYSNIGTLGAIAIVDQPFEYSIKNVALLKPISKYHSVFLFCYLESPENLRELTQKASGTSQKFFSLKFLRGVELVVPPSEILGSFAEMLTPILKTRSVLNNQIQNLRRTRDLLLPRLLSGQIDVGAA